jgi:hypothetical protein
MKAKLDDAQKRIQSHEQNIQKCLKDLAALKIQRIG